MPAASASWFQGDVPMQAVGVLLLGMSLASWFVIFWKTALLMRAARRVPRAIDAFWAAASASRRRAISSRSFSMRVSWSVSFFTYCW